MAREHYTSRGVRSGERDEGRAVGQHSLTGICSKARAAQVTAVALAEACADGSERSPQLDRTFGTLRLSESPTAH